MLALMLPALACVDKAFVSGLDEREARLAVAVELGTLAAQGDITAVRIVARYTSPAGPVVLRDETVPYQQGESRDVALTLDIGDCLRDVAQGEGAQAGCPVQVTVEVLAGTRVLARDELPVVIVRPGESAQTPALAARSANSVQLQVNNTVAPPTLPLVVGASTTLAATPLDAAGAAIAGRQITWGSSAPTVASVSAAGVVTALAPGQTRITARTGSGTGLVENGVVITVTEPVAASVRVAPAAASIGVGGRQALTATPLDAAGVAITPAPAVAWTSSQSTVATVSASGEVVGLAPGSAVITARTANGASGTATITVNAVPSRVALSPTPLNLGVGGQQTLAVAVTDAAGATITPTPALEWTTSAATVATVDAAGRVTAVAPGTATITARTANGVTGTATVNVAAVAATVQIAPAQATLAVSESRIFVPTVLDAQGAIIAPAPSVTWSTSAPTVATVSDAGLVTGISVGTATITARTASGVAGTATVTVATAATFSGRVYNAETNAGVPGATVTIRSGNTVIRTTTTDAQGNFASGPIAGAGPFDVRVEAQGFVTVNVPAQVANGSRTLEAVPLVRDASSPGVVSGSVLNATTNLPVVTPPTTLELYAGMTAGGGTPVATTTSTPNGTYQFASVAAGTYTLVARATGFSNASRTVVSYGNGRNATGQNVFISPTAATGSLRIVLTWGDFPNDLDSHLTGPAGNARFWVFFGQPGSCTSIPFACLDVDELFGNGPETITIAQRSPGRYVYSVHNFSAGDDNPNDTGLSRSNARVDVYGATGLITSFAVPSGAGTLWTVFEWDGTTITPINTISAAEPPASDSPAARRLPGPRIIKKKR